MALTTTATSTCDRCKRDDILSSIMVYWLVEITNRPSLGPMPDVAIGSPKYCPSCAQEIRLGLVELFGNQIRLFT